MTTLTNTPRASSPSPTRSLGERINLRMVVFLGVLAAGFLALLWMIINPKNIAWEGNYYAVDLKWMGNFPFNASRDDERAIPPDVLGLNGKKVKFEGEMFAPNGARDVDSFQLVYSIVECCMGGPPKVQERVFAYAPPGKTVPNYSGRQVTVIGTLHVDVKQDNGEAVSVFTMDVDEIRPRT